jgi:hypothetical protein
MVSADDPELAALRELLVSEDLWRSWRGGAAAPKDELLPPEVERFLKRFIGQLSSIEFDQTLFDACYPEFERALRSGTVDVVCTVPLARFASDSLPVHLEQGCDIIALDTAEVNRLAGALSVFWRLEEVSLRDVSELFRSRIALRYRAECDKREEDRYSREKGRADRALTAIRLVAGGDVRYSVLISEEEEPGGEGRTAFSGLSRARERRYYSGPDAGTTHLLADEVDRVTRAYRDLSALGERGDASLGVAIRRLNYTYDRRNIEDKIIDRAILLESTLLADDDKELAYHMALRGATIMSERRRGDPERTYRLVKRFYDVRNKIVHGSKAAPPEVSVAGKTMPIAEFMEEMQEVCREVLRFFVEQAANGKTPEDICRDLDARIVKSLARPEPPEPGGNT